MVTLLILLAFSDALAFSKASIALRDSVTVPGPYVLLGEVATITDGDSGTVARFSMVNIAPAPPLGRSRRLSRPRPGVENRAATNLQHVGIGQHAEYRDVRRPLHLLVEQAFAHEHRGEMMAFVCLGWMRHGDCCSLGKVSRHKSASLHLRHGGRTSDYPA